MCHVVICVVWLQEQGASCGVFAATVRELDGIGGYYFNNCCRCEPSDEACNSATAAKLWTFSETMLHSAKTLTHMDIT